jgi:hypothetical protein
MANDRGRTERGERYIDRGEQFFCPVCKQPVETVVKRRKVLGAFVPAWGPGACINPVCPAHAEAAERARPHPHPRPQPQDQPSTQEQEPEQKQDQEPTRRAGSPPA